MILEQILTITLTTLILLAIFILPFAVSILIAQIIYKLYELTKR
jgi:hypothetical protein